MKIYKQKEHSLILKPFGIEDRLYMAVAVLLFFDLDNPDVLLSEQQLWSLIPEQLDDNTVLDMGMPKPRGEVLVTGSCFAPRLSERTAGWVSLRVGPLEKRLDVFGDRFWVPRAGLGKVVSEPRPFTEIPLTYANAFGGPGFDRNPLGKGIAPVAVPDGRLLHPLPNIEDPHRLIGSPSDRPEPAGFGPLDLTWPQRSQKQGTYDDKWLKERWPYFPEDMDYEFFNTAPRDQFLEGFFNGSEQIELVNMHPERQVISSRLPGVRVRCFVTRRKSLNAATKDETIFEEVETRIETLWLFPSILRAVVICRGTCPILDDEFADVQRVFVASEDISTEPFPIDHYYEDQQKALDRTVNIDMAPLEAAGKKVARAMRKFKNLPKQIEQIKKQMLGRAPVMPMDTAAGQEAGTAGMLKDARDLVERLENRTLAFQAKWGHLARIAPGGFAAARSSIEQIEKQAGKILDAARQAQAKADEAQKQLAAGIKQRMDPPVLKKAGIDPEDPLSGQVPDPWHHQGFDFVVSSFRRLENDSQACDRLARLGLDQSTVARAWLGINPKEQKLSRRAWGLEPADDGRPNADELVLPRGLVIPRFDDALLTRILVIGDFESDCIQAHLVDGSDRAPLFLPAACLIELYGIEAVESAPAVVVADDFQALLMEQEVGDACSVVVLADPAEKPGDAAAAALSKAQVLLVVAGPEPDADLWSRWKAVYPNAVCLVLPSGKTVFQARAAGTDIRAWVMECLGNEIAADHQVAPQLPPAGKPPSGSPLAGLKFPAVDVKALVSGLARQVEARHQPLKQSTGQVEKRVRQVLESTGNDPDKLMAVGKDAGMNPARQAERVAVSLVRQKEKLRASGKLTPVLEKELDRHAARVVEMGKDADKRWNGGLAKLQAAKSKIEQFKAGQIPEGFNQKFELHGLGPDRMRKLTRQEVIDRHSRGRSLAGAVLDGLDLSGLDLRGADLTRALCRKTDFSQTDLSGADFSATLAGEANFAKANLRQVKAQKAVFTKAGFKQAVLAAADLSKAVFQQADLERADFTRARIYLAAFQKAVLKGADFSEAEIEMVVFSRIEAGGVRFCKARLSKCLFSDACLEGADFSEAVLPQSMFQGAQVAGASFCRADLTKTNSGGGSDFSKADFSAITMEQGCFRQAVFGGADFSGARITGSLFEGCDFKGACLAGVSFAKTRLARCDLEGLDMRKVNLFMGSLRKARLVNTDLRDANLYGVDFYKAVMAHTRLEGANCKQTLIQDKLEYLP